MPTDPFLIDPTQTDIFIGTHDSAGKVDRTAAKLHPVRLTAWDRGQVAEFTFLRKGLTMPLPTDPYLNRPVWVEVGGVLRFAGDVVASGVHFSHATGLVASYRCEDLRARGEQIPVTDDQTGGDICRFNLALDDTGYLASRAGRTVGQVLISVLEMDGIAAPLTARGIGGMTTGSGASYTATMTGGHVTAATVVQQGSGYSPSSPPAVLFVGGSPTTPATGHAVVSSSAPNGVTSIVVDNAGSGYRTTPRVLISRLPAATLADLAALDMIPPYEVSVRGEKLLQAIEATLTAYYPHHCLWVAPDGTLRFLDLLAFADATLTFGQDPIDDRIDLAVDLANCYPQVKCRSASRVSAKELSLKAGTLVEKFAYGGLTNQQAKDAWSLAQFEQPALVSGTATATATLATTSVANATVTGTGSGYTSGTATCTFSAPDDPGGTTATGTPVLGTGSNSDKIVSVTMVNHGSGYKTAPTITFGTPATGTNKAVGFATLSPTSVAAIAVTSNGSAYPGTPAVTIGAPTGSGPVQATAHAVMGAGSDSGTVQSIVVDNAGAGYTKAPSVHLSPPVPGSVVYGTITAVADTLHVTFKPDDAGIAWAAGYCDQSESGQGGRIALSSAVATGVDSLDTRNIVANTALVAGGTCDLTLDYALEQTTWDTGTIYFLATGGSRVWRYYAPADAAVAAAMTNENLSVPAVFSWADGAGSLTYGRSAQILYSPSGDPPYQSMPLYFDADPDRGIIKFSVPTVTLFGTRSNLVIGGPYYTDGIPSDIRVLLPVYDRSLEVQSPSGGGYSGTSNTAYGVQRTLTVTIPDWRDPTQTSEVQKYADRLQASVRDAIIEFGSTYYGVWTAALTPGIRLSLADLYGTTGLEAIAVPVVRVELSWPADGAASHATEFRCSNRMQTAAGTLFLPPPQVGTHLGLESGDPFYGGLMADSEGTLHLGFDAMSPADQAGSGHGSMSLEFTDGDMMPPGEDIRAGGEGMAPGPAIGAGPELDALNSLNLLDFPLVADNADPGDKGKGPVAGAGGALGVGTGGGDTINPIGDFAGGGIEVASDAEDKARGPVAGAGGALGVGKGGSDTIGGVGDAVGGNGVDVASSGIGGLPALIAAASTGALPAQASPAPGLPVPPQLPPAPARNAATVTPPAGGDLEPAFGGFQYAAAGGTGVAKPLESYAPLSNIGAEPAFGGTQFAAMGGNGVALPAASYSPLSNIGAEPAFGGSQYAGAGGNGVALPGNDQAGGLGW